MTIAFDVATTAVAYAAVGSQTTAHIASASARAAVVMIAQNAVTTDQITGVTYGGKAMTELVNASEATEAGQVSLWWLDDIAKGTQNVVMTSNGTANKQLCVATMTAAAGYKIVMASQNSATSASVANPSWDLTGLTALNGVSLTCFEVIHSGLTTMTTTPHAGWTRISSTDLGSQGRGFAYEQIAPAAGIIGCGWVAATADDFVGASVAFSEVALPIPYTLGGGNTLNTWINATDIAGTDGSSVTSITESSPNARVLNTVSGTAPVLRTTAGPNGTHILDHTGGAGGLYSATGGVATPVGDLTYFAVVKNPTSTEQPLMMGQYWYLPHLSIGADGHYKLIFNGMPTTFAVSTTPIGSGWSIAVITFTKATSSTHLDINDTVEDVSLGAVADAFFGDQGVSYGKYFDTIYFAGQTAEIGMYSSILSSTDITTLKNYLKAKYALPIIVLTPPDPPVVDISVNKLFITMPSALPGTSTSLSVYINGVKAVGLKAVDSVYQALSLDANVVYSVTVRGDGPAGETGDSTAVVATPNPAPPTGIVATPGDETVTISWNNIAYTGTWYIELQRNGTVILYGTFNSPFVDTGLSEGTNYTYKMRSVAWNPTGRYSAFSADVIGTPTPTVVVRNPNMLSDVGGPVYSVNREDMFEDPRSSAHQRALRSELVPWSDADRAFAGLEFLPPQWLAWMAGSSRDLYPRSVDELGMRIYLENSENLGPFWNFGTMNTTYAFAAGVWWTSAGGDFGVWVNLRWNTSERILIHECVHHMNHVVRKMLGLDELYEYGQAATPGRTLANEYLAAVTADEATRTVKTWTGSNIDELSGECYTSLIVANADPSWLYVPPNADFPAGVRADQYISAMCGNNADLTARWTAELKDPGVWPAAPWPVSRNMSTQLKVDTRRNAIVMPIQNLDSNEGPTLLLADATDGYRAATKAVGTTLTNWVRSDRPLPTTTGQVLVSAGSPTVELRNSNQATGAQMVYPVKLLGKPSAKWRATVTFRVGELLAVENTLWRARGLSEGGIETEYNITWNGATVSASLIRRDGSGGTVIDTTKVTSGNVLVVGERCTVQGVWGGQATAITLRHRTASAGSVTALTSAAMPQRFAVEAWSMPVPHATNGPTLSYCGIAAVSVETIHDGGVGPMTWMDADYA